MNNINLDISIDVCLLIKGVQMKHMNKWTNVYEWMKANIFPFFCMKEGVKICNQIVFVYSIFDHDNDDLIMLLFSIKSRYENLSILVAYLIIASSK
jgi:hypothetical protein